MTTCCSCKVRHLGICPHKQVQQHSALLVQMPCCSRGQHLCQVDLDCGPSKLFRECRRPLLGLLLTTWCQQQPAGLHLAI